MNLEFGEPFHNKTIDQCRIIGRLGGRARARNLRLRARCQATRPRAWRSSAAQACWLRRSFSATAAPVLGYRQVNVSHLARLARVGSLDGFFCPYRVGKPPSVGQ
jgi:hypothetical protein